MCGRYALFGPHSRYREHFSAAGDFDWRSRFNVAPSQMMPVVARDSEGQRRFVGARWGLIPSWVKDSAELAKPINAKMETAAVKPMFRHAFRKSRILVPADGFYEWKAEAGGKQPYFVRMRDQEPFGMAGLLEHWHGPEGEVVTFAILTTMPNAVMSEIHNRMPAIVAPDMYEAWLDPDAFDVPTLLAMLGPYPERLMEAYRVGRGVNRPSNDRPELIEPAEQ